MNWGHSCKRFSPMITLFWFSRVLLAGSHLSQRVEFAQHQSYQLLIHLQLDLLNFNTDLTDPPNPDSFAITLRHLDPLLSFSNLWSFNIMHARPLWLTDDDFRHLATKWPNVKELDLNSAPTECLDPPPATMLSVLHFAHLCPRLTHLGIFINANVVRPPSPMHYFHHFLNLCLGASHITHISKRGLLLHRMCPYGMQMDANVE
jgi:hypothetical protein